ncbi:hypothetical protein SUGI_0982610 [Cryptomeria japonica]|uniref:probable LRR receptor-like serine/threonine-protein kinase At1g74360 n=1 Tax=Cryptomeria japonica TaxID=3369 RepID=UPI0024147384|nr:probable LRR receptor-like serine/threonine-protein kinase At1g74360 [Cryptomeria japonica]XP_057860765.1 probable LRR receptor-like serine/threonine-protein kinase At1g74360 [Cryptomeria japonica]GLJ46632.1 hypothetical protein SUGI_0982610 [Cryptomeria japonica]
MKKMIQAKSLLLLVVLIVTVSSELVEQDKEALQSIRGFLFHHNPQSTNLKQWLKNTANPCVWLGIKCSSGKEETRVKGLNLSYFNLSGILPPALTNLTALSSLNLCNNNFSGTIPEELSRPLSSSLRYLDLSLNNLTGEISPNLFSICPQLTFLNLSSNRIVGQLPAELKNCRNLEKVALRRNNFTGSIPDDLLRNCAKLTHVDLEYNKLTGNIPDIHVNCSFLTELWLSQNHLTGQVPKGLGALSKLKTLVLGKNRLTGTIPPELSRLTKLQLLSIDYNWLEGPIPPSLGQMVSLQTLLLHTNKLSGKIPKELSSLANLSLLNLNNNNFSGAIPSELSIIRSLRLLFIGTNYLSGTIPPEIGNLTELQGLDLSENRLSGPIPATISKLQSLLWFSVSENNLEGQLPPEIVNCSSLVWLNVANNQLSGPIPPNIGRIGADANKTFSQNKQNPFVPEIVGGCWAMSRWFPQNYPFIYKTFKRSRCNQFWTHILQGTMPYPICINNPKNYQAPAYIQLSGNRFTGTIPESLANHSRLGALILADNHLYGQIPEAIAALSDLYYLNLSYNHLSGSIPEKLGQLACLDMLDLRNNSLEGIIPGTLANLTSLASFNVSYNPNLRGQVPSGGQFITFIPDSYMGDSLLLGILQKNNHNNTFSSSNPAKISRSNKLKNWVIGGICIVAAGILIIIALSSLCLCRRRKNPTSILSKSIDINSLEHAYFSVPLAPEALTYNNIMKATDNFSESRCIGRGGQGVVYRAELAEGFHVAVKRLCHEDAEADVDFLAELQTLGGLNHPNLVPLLGCCLRGNQRIFIYKLIENGSLEEWLHDPTGLLEWPFRIKIAVGCSLALKFLHHECPSVIIHRDIKASNVLLDGGFNAFVTDFGLARNQSKDMSHVSTVVAGTLGYVPPEYSYSLKATTKGDVYSFGVVLMQLATGMRAIGVDDELEGGLVAWVNSTLDRRTQNIFDPRMLESDTWDEESGLQLLRLACLCTTESPQRRPNMIEVASVLQDISDCLYSSPTS